MANFEGLIRGALAAKGAATPDQRQIVYESSRTALKKLIEANRSLTVEQAVYEQRSLEDAISSIETSYQFGEPDTTGLQQAGSDGDPVEFEQAETSVLDESDIGARLLEDEHIAEEPVVSEPEINQASEQVTEPASLADQFEASPTEPEPQSVETNPEPEREKNPFEEIEQILGRTVKTRQDEVERDQGTEVPKNLEAPSEVPTVSSDEAEIPVSSSAPSVDAGMEADASRAVPPEFVEKRKRQRTGLWTIAILVLLAAIAWIGYRLFVGVVDGSLLGLNNNANQGITQSESALDQSSNYITILEPGDLTALVVSDRGRVEIINEQSLEMIRLFSVRDSSNRLNQAEPILLKLKPGVIEQIRGKRVTAEVFARSGTSNPAQFAVECRFGENIGCGRKRFRVGVQPEASIFAFTLEETRDINEVAQIAINTDITDNAAITGEGDVLDIVYVRLRSTKQ